MSEPNPTPRPMPRWILPVVAGVASIAVGVTSFLVTAPFAAPRVVPPETIIVDQLTLNDGFESLADVAAEGEPQLLSASVPRSNPDADAAATLAAALDAIDATARGEEPAESESEPAGGITVLDPCLGASSPDDPCPDGSRATVLASVAAQALQVWAEPAIFESCTVESRTTSVGYAFITTLPVSVTVRWVDGGRDKSDSFVTSAAARERWATSAAGEEGGSRITHCGSVSGLTAGWSGRLTFTATAEDGSTASATLDVGTGAGLVVPPSYARPLTNSAVMVSVPSNQYAQAQFHAIAVPFGERAAECDFGEFADTLAPATTASDTVTAEQLDAAGYLPAYVRRHAAFFVVPEASTITFCAGVGSEGRLFDTIFSEVLHSPDLVLPVVSVVGFEVAPGVRANEVELSARSELSAPVCGSWRLFDAPGTILCDYSRINGDYLGWDAALTIKSRGSALGSSAERDLLVPVSPQPCGLGCELPTTQFVDVPVSYRDPCLGNGCPASFLGTVRLQVDWEHGTRSWFSDWLSAGAGPALETPTFDTISFPAPVTEVREDGILWAGVGLETDVPTSVVVEAYRLEEGEEPVLAATWTDTSVSTEHAGALGPLEGGGVWYGFLARFTDAEGDTSVYSWRGGKEREWAHGILLTPTAEVRMTAEVTVQAADGGPIAVGVAELIVGNVPGWQQPETGIREIVCGSGPVRVPFTSDAGTSGGRNPTTGVALLVEVSPLGENGVDATGCTWRGDRPPAESFIARIPYRDALDGVTATVTTESGYTAVIRLTPAP